jgi:long-chain acyl-CoA synthetase
MQMTLADTLRRAEKLFADRIAIRDGEVKITYRELADRCRRLAGALAGLGVRSGDRVATLLMNGHRYLEVYFAVPGLGAVLVPLNNRHVIAEHRAIIADAGASVLVIDRFHESVGEELASMVNHVVLVPDGYDQFIREADPVPLGRGVTENDLAGLFYTGGTTGGAKGVMLTHRNLVANALHTVICLTYTQADTYLHAAPMFHLADGASTWAITWVGGGHAFVPAFEPASVLYAIAETRTTVVTMVPTMINAVVNHPDVAESDLSSLRLVLHGGAPIAESLLTTAIKMLGCSFTQVYGMTEAAPILTSLTQEERLLGDQRLRSAGQEIAGVEVTVRHQDGTLCDSGEVGEIVARGPNFMTGYWNKLEETAQVLRDGWYWSGDLAYTDDEGYLYIVDRTKDMIISGGENVYSVEVEDAVMAHPAVFECAAIAVPDDTWGERVHVAVVMKPGQSVELEELKAFCGQRIAGYKCPRSMEVLDTLPRSGAGKILKRQLRDPHWTGRERQVH